MNGLRLQSAKLQDRLDFGFIDRIAEPMKLAASFDVARFRNAPPEVVEAASEAEEPAATEPQTEVVADSNTLPDPEQSTAEAPTVAAVEPTSADVATVRAEAIAHARAVIDLCSLAGQPQMAGRFLEEDVGLDDVRNRLLAAKAEATPDITAAHAQPGRAATTNPWGEVIARTFKTKG